MAKDLQISGFSPPPAIHCVSLQVEIRRAPWRLGSLGAQSSHVFYWMTRGQGRVSINGVLRGYGPNTLIFLPSGSVHSLIIGANTQGYAAYLHHDLPVPVPQDPAIMKATSMADQGLITGHFEHLIRENASGRTGSDHAMESHLTLLSVWIVRNTDENLWLNRAPASAAERLVSRFLIMLEAQHKQKHQVAEYASDLAVTTTHLTRQCQLTFGKSAIEMIQNRLIYAARLHLRETKLPMSAIAQQLGFSSLAYFSRLFHQKTGLTPSAFRALPRMPSDSLQNSKRTAPHQGQAQKSM